MNITSLVPIAIYDAQEEEFAFDNLSQLYRFFGREIKFWREHSEKLAENGDSGQHRFFECVSGLEEIRGVIDSWRDQLSEWDETKLEQETQNLQQNYDDFLRTNWLCSKHPYVRPFIQYHLDYGLETATAFMNYALYEEVDVGPGPGFRGTMLGYEFFYQSRHIKSRREGEKRSLENLRNQLLDGIKELDTKVEFNKKRGERQNLEQRTAFEEQMELWKKEVTNLEQLYEEKLHLEKPAEYWSKTATKHKKHGLAALGGLLVFSSVVLCALGYFFSGWLQGQGFPLSLKTLQGVVLFGSFMAIFAYSIRILARLTFSSFHLMRDAEEREQLTYLYLSLSKTNPAEKASREIILRSLFSRSQTGLLANETGPSIPAEIVQAQK